MSSALINIEYASATDAELLNLYQRQHDPEAFANLVKRHGPMVMGIAERMLGCRHSAEDVVQATFLVLAKDSRRIRQATSVSSWLYGVAYRIASRITSRRIRERRIAAAMPVGQAVMTDDPLANVSAQYERNAVFEEVHRLPQHLRTPMVLRYFQGHSNAEVAAALGLSESAIEGRLKRGRNQLRMRLIRKGVTFAAAICIMDSLAERTTAAIPAPLLERILRVRPENAASVQPPLSEAIRTLAHKEFQRMALISVIRTTSAALLATGAVASTWMLTGDHLLFAQYPRPASSITLTAEAEAPAPSGVSATFSTKSTDANAAAATSTATATNPPSSADPFAPSPQQQDPFEQPSSQPDPFAGAGSAPSPNPRQNDETNVDSSVDISFTYRSERESPSQIHLREFTPAEQQIYNTLENPAKLEFLDVPLIEAIAFISQNHDIQVIFDTRALDEEGISQDELINISIHDVKLASALNLMLKPLDLTTIVSNEVLVVTTRTRAEEHVEVRVYQHDATLAKLIETTVAPETWSSAGGAGSIQAVKGGLIVSQTQAVHREIEELLRQLSRLRP